MPRKTGNQRSKPLINPKFTRRLADLREGRRNLWDDDDDSEEEEEERSSKSTRRKPSRARVLSESDDELEESSRRQMSKRSKGKHPQCCLICSILNQLSNENCCSKHLTLLKNPSSSILPNHVMIIPVHDDLLHQYLDSQEIHRLKMKTSSIATQTTLSVNQTETCQSDRNEMTASSITIDPKPTSEIIIIDDSPVNNPWTSLPDDVDATLEGLISQIETEPAYTPITARKTETEFMASRLPKIPLKPGRFRLGKPVPPPATTVAAADEYRPSNNALTQDTLQSEATPSNNSPRVYFQKNPDGTSVQISRPSFSGSPSLQLLRRNSTDVTPKPL